MKILFHDNFLSERGTTTSTLNYALALRREIGAEVWMSCNGLLQEKADPRVLKNIERQMPVFQYSSINSLHDFARQEQFDFFYAQKSGQWDRVVVPTATNLIHAVFAALEPHGQRYAYISEWLAKYVRRSPKAFAKGVVSASRHRRDVSFRSIMKTEFDWVPLLVDVLERQGDYREAIGVPANGLLIGSLSAPSEFNVPVTLDWVEKYVEINPDVFFVFPNLQPFADHPRIRFIPKLIGQQEKADYLHSLDIFLHARMMGESFGMAMCEALQAGKPVLSWRGGHDRHHVQLLDETGWLYESGQDLTRIVGSLRESPVESSQIANSLVAEFRAEPVIRRFERVFLN